DKLNDSRWKPGKEDKGVTQFSWLGDGVATRVDAIMKGDVNIIRKIVEQVFRDMKLFSKQEIEDVDKDTSMLQFRVNSPFPFSPRYVSADVQYHMTSSSESSAVIYDSDRRATPSGHQRAKMETSGVYIMRKERNSVVVSVMIHLDMRSSVPNWALSSQSSALKKNLYKMMKARAVQFSKQGTLHLGQGQTVKRSAVRVHKSPIPLPMRSSPSSSRSSDIERHIRAILQNDFSSLPNLLSIIPREDWNVFADLLYGYHLETDAWPLVLWSMQQRTQDDLSLDEETFHGMISKRNLYSDVTVKWNRTIIEEFHMKAKTIYEEIENFDGEEEKQKICDLISSILRNQAEADREDIPIMALKNGALFNQFVGLGDDYLDNTDYFWLKNIVTPLIKNPTLVGIDDLNYVRPVKLQALLDECGRLIHRYGEIKKNPIGEPYQSVMEHWAKVTTHGVPHRYSMENAEKMERIWRAQVVPNSKKMNQLEKEIRKLIEGYTGSDDSSSIDQYDIGTFNEKLKDSRWKAGKEENGVTQFTWLGDGVAARVDAVSRGDVDIRKIVEKVFRDMKLFSKQEMETIGDDAATMHFRVDTPFPFSPRYVNADILYRLSSSDSSAVFYDSNRRATPSGHQRAKVETSGVHITRKGNEQVVSVMLHVDMRSSVPNWALSSQSSALKKNLYKTMKARALQELDMLDDGPASHVLSVGQYSSVVLLFRFSYVPSLQSYRLPQHHGVRLMPSLATTHGSLRWETWMMEVETRADSLSFAYLDLDRRKPLVRCFTFIEIHSAQAIRGSFVVEPTFWRENSFEFVFIIPLNPNMSSTLTSADFVQTRPAIRAQAPPGGASSNIFGGGNDDDRFAKKAAPVPAPTPAPAPVAAPAPQAAPVRRDHNARSEEPQKSNAHTSVKVRAPPGGASSISFG
ncbi:hypothetical protein PROFUN_08224, partial [Planoprotostelium fungivorum]